MASRQNKHIFPIILEDIGSTTDVEKAFHYTVGSILWTMCKPGDDYDTNVSKLKIAMKNKGITDSDFFLSLNSIFLQDWELEGQTKVAHQQMGHIGMSQLFMKNYVILVSIQCSYPISVLWCDSASCKPSMDYTTQHSKLLHN